jgi:hypothetical protein
VSRPLASATAARSQPARSRRTGSPTAATRRRRRLRRRAARSRREPHAHPRDGAASAGRLPRGRVGGFSDSVQEASDLLGVGDQGHEAHASGAARTAQDVDREAALEELGPGAIARAAPGRGAGLEVVGGSRGGRGHDARAQLAGGGQDPGVADGVKPGRGPLFMTRASYFSVVGPFLVVAFRRRLVRWRDSSARTCRRASVSSST